MTPRSPSPAPRGALAHAPHHHTLASAYDGTVLSSSVDFSVSNRQDEEWCPEATPRNPVRVLPARPRAPGEAAYLAAAAALRPARGDDAEVTCLDGVRGSRPPSPTAARSQLLGAH